LPKFYDLQDEPIPEGSWGRPAFWYQCIPKEYKNPFKKSCGKCQIDMNVSDIDRLVIRMESLQAACENRRGPCIDEATEERLIMKGKDRDIDGPI